MFIVQAYRNDLLLNVSEPSPHCNLLQSSFLADAKNVLKSFCKKEWGLGGEGKKLFAKSLFPHPQNQTFYRMSRSSTSKTRAAQGGMDCPAPCSP